MQELICRSLERQIADNVIPVVVGEVRSESEAGFGSIDRKLSTALALLKGAFSERSEVSRFPRSHLQAVV